MRRFPKRGSFGWNKSKPHAKRNAANKRNASWASLSPQEQLAVLDKEGWRAERQRKKIAALLKG